MSVNYPIPQVTVTQPDQDPRPNGASVKNMAQLAAEQLANRAAARNSEPWCAPPPSGPVVSAAPGPDYGEELTEAAKAIQAVRAKLARIDTRLKEFSEKSTALAELQTNLNEAREQRSSLLSEALIAGKKANTVKVDERCAAAAAALDKRHDEITALERAIETLQAQRASASADLAECERGYAETLEKHQDSIARARILTEGFYEAMLQARQSLSKLPLAFRARLVSPPLTPECDPFPEKEQVIQRVLSHARALMSAAAETADIPPPPLPKFLGFVWSDGSVHQEAELASAQQAPDFSVGRVNDPTTITTAGGI